MEPPSLILISAILAFIITTGVIFGLRPIARQVGLVDVPNGRKVHEGQIPLVGGISIFAGVLCSHIVTIVFADKPTLNEPYLGFYAGALLLLLIGMIDDYRELAPSSRLIAQGLAGIIMAVAGGVVVRDLGSAEPLGSTLALGVLAVPFTVFGAIGVINAVNMSDGLDGLAGCLTAVPLLGFLFATLAFGHGDQAELLSLLTASVIAFLMFNVTVPGKRKALIFLGDAGSMFLGFALVWFAVSLSQGPDRAIQPASALWFLMIPVFDTVCLMARRIERRRPVFSADREHLHHIFLLAGFSVSETVLIMATIAGFGVGIGLAGTYFQISDIFLASAFVICGLLYFWTIRRAWTVMRFLRRSICRRRNIADRRVRQDRRRNRSRPFVGPDKRSGQDRRLEFSRREGERPTKRRT
jgi:UDP-GlcNAc:undecaprenyl-phosphate GlcNAc-1-phosphate transferase